MGAQAVRFLERVVLEQEYLVAEARVLRVSAMMGVAWVASCRLGAVVLASCLYLTPSKKVSSPPVHHVWGSVEACRLVSEARAVLLEALVLILAVVSALSFAMSLGLTCMARYSVLRLS